MMNIDSFVSRFKSLLLENEKSIAHDLHDAEDIVNSMMTGFESLFAKIEDRDERMALHSVIVEKIERKNGKFDVLRKYAKKPTLFQKHEFVQHIEEVYYKNIFRLDKNRKSKGAFYQAAGDVHEDVLDFHYLPVSLADNSEPNLFSQEEIVKLLSVDVFLRQEEVVKLKEEPNHAAYEVLSNDKMGDMDRDRWLIWLRRMDEYFRRLKSDIVTTQAQKTREILIDIHVKLKAMYAKCGSDVHRYGKEFLDLRKKLFFLSFGLAHGTHEADRDTVLIFASLLLQSPFVLDKRPSTNFGFSQEYFMKYIPTRTTGASSGTLTAAGAADATLAGWLFLSIVSAFS